MLKKIALGCLLPLVVLSVIGYFTARALLKPKPKPERSETVTRGDVEIKVIETGTIEPLRKVEVKSKVGGRLEKLFVDAGDRVRQGQTLAIIDPQEVNSQVAALKAQLAGAEARLAAARKNARFQRDQTATNIAQFRQNVAVTAARWRQAQTEAAAQPELTRQAIEIAQANLEAARATLTAQQDSLELMIQSTHPQALANAESAYEQARVQAENARKNVERQKQLLQKGFLAAQVVDNAETEAQVAEARLREAKVRIDRIRQANALEQANQRSLIANAQSQVKQMEAALAQAKTNVLPETRRRELESARAAYEQARAQLAQALAGKTQDAMRQDEAASAEAERLRIQNELNELLVRQSDTTLTAAMSGVVTRRYAEEGELIASATSSFSNGTAVFQIADLSKMLIKINVNEVDVAKIRPGMLTEVTIDSSKGITFTGRVRKIAPAALTDSTSGTAGGGGSSQSVIRFPVEIQIDQADPRLKPGMSARCNIIVARRRNVLRLPTNCVPESGSKATIQVVTTAQKDGKPVETTSPREVTIGLRGDDFAEIKSGLKENEKARPLPYKGPPRKQIEINFGGDRPESR